MSLGVRNHIRMTMLDIPVKLTSETIEWEPGRRMGFRSIKPGALRSVWRLAELEIRQPQAAFTTWRQCRAGRRSTWR